MAKANNWFSVSMKGAKSAEILVYGVIGVNYWDEEATSAKEFNTALNELVKEGKTDIAVRLNSPGGNIFDGLAMYAGIQQHQDKVTCYVDGLAASVASVVALAGKKCVMAADSFLMIHNPSSCACGTAADMRHNAEVLEKFQAQIVELYGRHCNKDAAAIQAAMDESTWLNAEDAQEWGFCDEVSAAMDVAALLDPTLVSLYCPTLPEAVAAQLHPDTTTGKQPAAAALPLKEPTEDPNMSKEQASYNELKMALPKADPAFLCECQDKSLTVEASKDAYLQAQETALAEAKAQHETAAAQAKADLEAAEAKAKADVAAAKAQDSGTGGVGNSDDAPAGGGGAQNATAQINEAVTAKMAANPGMAKNVAHKAVCSEQPELRAAYVAESNI